MNLYVQMEMREMSIPATANLNAETAVALVYCGF
jgi:hypothetical protein